MAAMDCDDSPIAIVNLVVVDKAPYFDIEEAILKLLPSVIILMMMLFDIAEADGRSVGNVDIFQRAKDWTFGPPIV